MRCDNAARPKLFYKLGMTRECVDAAKAARDLGVLEMVMRQRGTTREVIDEIKQFLHNIRE